MAIATYSANYYDRLGLDRGCDARLLKSQYRMLARLYHPDVNPSQNAKQQFIGLQEAYQILGNEEKRRDYDQWLQRELRHGQPLRLELQLSPERLIRPYGPQRVYALLTVNILAEAAHKGAPLNVVLVLDRSSSMKGSRLHYVKEAARRILSQLSPKDTFGIVAFNDRANVVFPASPASDTQVARTAIDGITPSGGTEIASGLRTGIQEVIRYHRPNVLSHVLLLTDGRTYGDEEMALEIARQASDLQIGITALGLGTDWNDSFLDELSSRTGGSSHFIAQADQAVEIFQEQLQQLQRTFARKAKLRLDLGPNVELLQAHEIAPGLRRLPTERNEVALGPLSATPTLRVLLDLKVSLPIIDVALLGQIRLGAQLVENSSRVEVERLAVAEIHAGEPKAPPDEIYEAAQRVATLKLQERAWAAIEQGAVQQAVDTLEQLAARFLEIGADNLAMATQREMALFQSTGALSDDGRKIIKYGTRMLALPAPVD